MMRVPGVGGEVIGVVSSWQRDATDEVDVSTNNETFLVIDQQFVSVDDQIVQV